MSRPSPQGQSPAVDCRACRHCFDVRDGRSLRCERVDGSTWIPWHLVASDPCDDFEPKPAPASPPVSADREEPDLLVVLRNAEAAMVVGGNIAHAAHYFSCAASFQENAEALRRAISSEETRRARPTIEDPRDAEIAKLRALLELCATSIRDAAALTRDGQEMARRLHCLGSLASHEGGEQEFHACLAALHAAGVELKP